MRLKWKLSEYWHSKLLKKIWIKSHDHVKLDGINKRYVSYIRIIFKRVNKYLNQFAFSERFANVYAAFIRFFQQVFLSPDRYATALKKAKPKKSSSEKECSKWEWYGTFFKESAFVLTFLGYWTLKKIYFIPSI